MPESEVPDKFVSYSAVNVLPYFRTIPSGIAALSRVDRAGVVHAGPVAHGRQIEKK